MIIVNLSVQRTGTKSISHFFSKAGFKALAWREQNSALWDIHAINKRYDKIVNSELFKQNEIFSDTPFWDLGLAKYIHNNIEDVFFVYLKRNKKDWFRSMATHSKGMTFDDIRVHNYYYRREDDLEFLKSIGLKPKSLYILDNFTHYTEWYEQNHIRVLEFFKNISDDKKYFGCLDDKNIWNEMVKKFNLSMPDQNNNQSHTHQTSEQKKLDTMMFHSQLENFFGGQKIIERNYD